MDKGIFLCLSCVYFRKAPFAFSCSYFLKLNLLYPIQ